MIPWLKDILKNMARKKIDITIVRSKWRTGGCSDNSTGKGTTKLLNKQGFKCCLGFIASEFRPPNKGILNRCFPQGCDFKIPDLVDNDGDTQLTNSAISINDDVHTTQKEKEVALKKLFKKSCYNLIFVD